MTSLQDIRNEIEVNRRINQPVSLPVLFSKIGYDDFWAKHCGSLPFDIAIADIRTNSDSELSYSGKTNFLNVSFPEINILFRTTGSAISVLVNLPLPADWKFSESFPKLPPSLDLSTADFDSKNSYLDSLPLSNAGIQIAAPGADATNEGVIFTGDLALTGPYDIISSLSDKPVLPLLGNIRLTGEHPDLLLKADVSLRKDFVFETSDIFFSDVAVKMYSLLEAESYDPKTGKIQEKQEWFDFSALLHFNNDKFKVDLRAILVLGNSDFILLQGVFEDDHKVQIPSPGDLANFIGANKLDDLLPAALKGDTNLYLSDFDFCFGTTDFQINYAGFTLELNKTFTLLKTDSFEIVLRNIQAHFQVDDPLHDCLISFYLTGEFDFGADKNVQLVVKASSNLLFYCRLKPGTTIDIDKIFTYFGHEDDLKNMKLRDIAVTQFDITIDYKNSYYSFFVDVTGTWSIPAGKSTIDITGISFAISKATTVDFSASGKFVIAGAEFLIGIQKAGSSWTFSGITHPVDGGNGILLGEFINRLISDSGQTLPTEVAGRLSTLKIDYMSCVLGTEQIYFELDVEFDLGFAQTDKMKIYVRRSITDKQADYEIYFEYGFGEDLYFDLKLNWGQQTDTVLSGEIKTRSGKPVSFDVNFLLEKIGTSLNNIKLPKIDAIALQSASFTINLTKTSFNLQGKVNSLNFLLVAEKKASWGFAIAVDYSSEIKLSDIVSGVSLPDFADIEDLYIAYSSIDRSLTFDTANEKRPSLELKQNKFNLGCHLKISGKVSSFIQDHFGSTVDLWINGAVGFNPLELDIAAELDSAPSSTLSFTAAPGNKTQYPAFRFDKLIASLGISLQNIIFALTAKMTARINSKDVIFAGKIAFEENQFEVSATMEGDTLTIDFNDYKLELNNVAIEIGDGYELIDPVIGFTGEITVAGVNGFLAVLADTAEPQNCMFAASCSSINGSTLASLVQQLCTKGDAASMKSLDALNEISLQGTDINNQIPYSDALVADLNSAIYPKVIADQLTITHPVVTGGGKNINSWFITDTDKSEIYEIRRNGNLLDLRKELQLYIVPGQKVSIGDKTFYQGVRLNACLKIFSFEAIADIDISTAGIEFTTSINKKIDLGIILLSDAKDDSKGPSVSVSTFAKNPHFIISSKLVIARIISDVTDISFVNQQFHINLKTGFFIFQAQVSASGDYSQLLKSSFSLSIALLTEPLSQVATNISNSIKNAANSAASGFETLEKAVDDANKKVETLSANIASCDSKIAEKEAEIAQLKQKQSEISNWDYLWGKGEVDWGIYAAQIVAAGVEIGTFYTGKGTLIASKKIANGVLDLAKAALQKGETLTTEALTAISKAITEIGKTADWFLQIKYAGISVAVEKMNSPVFDTRFDVLFLGKEHSFEFNIDFSTQAVISNIEAALHDALYKAVTAPPAPGARIAVREAVVLDENPPISTAAELQTHLDALNEIIGRQQANLGNDHINNNINLQPLTTSLDNTMATLDRVNQLEIGNQAMDTAAIRKVLGEEVPLPAPAARRMTTNVNLADKGIKQIREIRIASLYHGKVDKSADPNTTVADKHARLNNASEILQLLDKNNLGFDKNKLTELMSLIAEKKAQLTTAPEA